MSAMACAAAVPRCQTRATFPRKVDRCAASFSLLLSLAAAPALAQSSAPAISVDTLKEVDQDAVVRRVRGTRADHARRGQGDRLYRRADEGGGAEAGQSTASWFQDVPLVEIDRAERDADDLHRGQDAGQPDLSHRHGARDVSRDAQDRHQELRRRVRRLWHQRARKGLERLCRRRREGEDRRRPRQRSRLADAGQRPASSRARR